MPRLASLTSQILTGQGAVPRILSLEHSLELPFPSTNEYFGRAVAISGNRAIVGAENEDDTGRTDVGKAFIFDVTDGSLLHTLDNPNNTSYDRFGNAVDIDGDRAIVGTIGLDDAGGNNSGAAYIFDVTTGALLHTIANPNADGTSANDNFGASVAISGNRAIVGANGESHSDGVTTVSFTGKAYIFDVTTGGLLHTLDNPRDASFVQFGNTVDIDGNFAIVGAIRDSATGWSNSGAAHIFSVTTGALVRTLENPNAFGTRSGDNFGVSVAISGNRAIVGAHNEDDAGGSSAGKAYIFDASGGALLHTLDNPTSGTSNNDKFGISVDINGSFCIVGAYEAEYENNVNYENGRAYIFSVSTGALIHTLDSPNPPPTGDDYFGYAVSISDTYALVGAWGENRGATANVGRAHVFKY